MQSGAPFALLAEGARALRLPARRLRLAPGWPDQQHGTDARRLIPRHPACELVTRLIDVRRLPYLFSVAPSWFRVEGLPVFLTPPSKSGFSRDTQAAERRVRALAATRRSHLARAKVLLMEQNQRAYERFEARGQTRFNEGAFDRGEALYDGELAGLHFRSVVKTFQVKAWRSLKARYRNLQPADRAMLPVAVRDAFEQVARPGPSHQSPHSVRGE
ncbi:MAG: hypothetical protein WCE62_19205 [Polyangiales bacterium]